VRPHVDATLAGPAQLDACAEAARQLPVCGTVHYLECRLEDDPRVDFLVLLERRHAVATAFTEALGARPLSGAWARNLALLQAWGDDRQALSQAQLVWLEYDIDARFNPERPDASVSVCVETDYVQRYSGEPRVDSRQALALANEAASHLVEPGRRQAVQRALERCVRALPPRGALIYLSEMSAREPAVTKLYLALPRPTILHYLLDIGWTGELKRVFQLLNGCHRELETVFLDVSIGAGDVLPKLGFAFSQLQARELAAFDPTWNSLLSGQDVLAAKRDALQRWPGHAELALDGVRAWMRRWLDVKLVLEEGGRIRSKAYLGYHARLAPLFA